MYSGPHINNWWIKIILIFYSVHITFNYMQKFNIVGRDFIYLAFCLIMVGYLNKNSSICRNCSKLWFWCSCFLIISFWLFLTVVIHLFQGARKSAIGQRIIAILPYIKQEIPIIIVFRALGFVSDRDILEHIIYDFDDPEMMEMVSYLNTKYFTCYIKYSWNISSKKANDKSVQQCIYG